MSDFVIPQRVQGRARLLDESGRVLASTWNLVLFDWAPVVAGALSRTRHETHWLNYMYLEFNNGGQDVDPTPLVTRDAPYAYYASLNSSHPTRDYLRTGVYTDAFENGNPSQYSAENRLKLLGRAGAGTGQHGLPFSYASQSKIYGGAVVCARNPSDPSQDLCFARFYFPPGQQILLRQTGQIICVYELEII